MTDRYYDLPLRRLNVARGGILFFCLAFVVFAALNPGQPIWLWPLEIGVCAWGVWGLFFAEIRPSESKSGFQTRSQQSFLWQRTSWAEIERFAEAPRNPLTGLRLACIVRKGGPPIPIMAISADRTVTWDGGETDDIVGELNARLDGWRRELGLKT